MLARVLSLSLLALSLSATIAAPPVSKAEAVLDIDYASGRVTAVHITKSTGQPKFDRAAIKAFMKWRFKPRTMSHVRVPINFQIRSDNS